MAISSGLTTKQRGELAEMMFMVKTAAQGIAVARPYGDSERYDFVIEANGSFLRIQVKAVFSTCRGEFRRGYPIQVARHRRSGVALYTPDQVDFIVALVAPYDAWYILPIEAVAGRQSMRFYPGGKARNFGATYEQYREAWHLLRE